MDAQELHDAEEVILFPPIDDDDEQSKDPVSEAASELANAAAASRAFVVKASDDTAAAECLEAFFAGRGIEPISMTVLDVDIPLEWLSPFDGTADDAAASFQLPFLILLRGLDPVTIEQVLCWGIANGGSPSDA